MGAFKWVASVAVLVGGIFAALSENKKPSVFKNLNHIKLHKDWEPIKNAAWQRASSVLSAKGIAPKTKCGAIIVENGVELNPKTGQWGRPSSDGEWYAGRCGLSKIQIVGTPEKRPYPKSAAIMTHEVAESILNEDKFWRIKSNDQRNAFLWGLGL